MKTFLGNGSLKRAFFLSALALALFVSCVSVEDSGRAGTAIPLQGNILRGFGISTDPVSGDLGTHPGVDIAAKIGTVVRSAGDGVVSETGRDPAQGDYVVIDHANRVRSFYAQLDEISVSLGQSLRRGDPLGKSGKTGRSAYPHLHFGVYVDGVPVDPLRYIGSR